jgi:hypothetical protein
VSAGTVPLPDDDLVEAELRRLAGQADPVPAEWGDAARAAVAWLALEGEPALLAYDSVSGRERPLEGTRLTAVTMRELRYQVGDQAIDLELDVGSDAVRILGRLAPAREVEVTVTWPEGRRLVVSDDRGVFHLDELPRRPLCFLVAGEEPTKTGWVVT